MKTRVIGSGVAAAAVLLGAAAVHAKPAQPSYKPVYEYVANQPTDLPVAGVTRNVTIDARCSPGNVLVSGGAAYSYSTQGTPNGDVTTFNPSIELVSSYPFKGTFWRAEWHIGDPNVTSVSELRTFAVCVNPK